jgi:hypothetical protein
MQPSNITPPASSARTRVPIPGKMTPSFAPIPSSSPVPTAQPQLEPIGKAIRVIRENIADFIYIAGWELDLETFIDPPVANPRQTLHELLEQAVKKKVEIRILLPAKLSAGQLETTEKVAKLGGGVPNVEELMHEYR